MSKLKLKTLLEGFAWERKADGSLPTLADTTAAHAAKMANEAVGQEDADARWNDPISNAMRHLTSRSKVSGLAGKAPRNFYAEKLAALKAQRKQLEFDMEQEAEPEGGPIADYYGDALNHIDQQINAIRSKMTENVDEEKETEEPRWQDSDGDGKWYEPEDLNEYGEEEFDRSSQMYGGGKSRSEGKEILDLVSEAENVVQNLRRNMATNSVLQREEKMGYLRAYDELLDLLSDIGFQAEMTNEAVDVTESAYKNSSNNELASHIGQLTSELKAEKDPKKQAIIRKDLEACKSELKSRKQNEGLTARDLDLISKFKKNLNESARRY